MSVNIQKIATLSRLNLSAEELVSYGSHLGQILAYVNKLETLDTTGIEPTAHPALVTDITREDIARPGMGAEALLPNAPRQAQGQVQVPRVVE